MEPGKNLKLLLVDDDEASRILIRDILEGANVTILECGCGIEAMELYKKYAWELDLVLLDIRLPDCNGWELVRQFRLINPLVIFIAISATSPPIPAAASPATEPQYPRLSSGLISFGEVSSCALSLRDFPVIV